MEEKQEYIVEVPTIFVLDKNKIIKKVLELSKDKTNRNYVKGVILYFIELYEKYPNIETWNNLKEQIEKV